METPLTILPAAIATNEGASRRYFPAHASMPRAEVTEGSHNVLCAPLSRNLDLDQQTPRRFMPLIADQDTRLISRGTALPRSLP